MGGCNSKNKSLKNFGSNPVAVFKVSGGVSGTFTVQLFFDRMPRTVSNFVDLANSGFYNGLHFHRVIPGCMNQFGCPHSRNPKSKKCGKGGPDDGEFINLDTDAKEIRFNNGYIEDEHEEYKDTNAEGTLALANTEASPDPNGSQFFINVADNPNLDWFSDGGTKHPVFGKVIKNYDLCVTISRVQRNKNDRPRIPIKMESVTVSGI